MKKLDGLKRVNGIRKVNTKRIKRRKLQRGRGGGGGGMDERR